MATKLSFVLLIGWLVTPSGDAAPLIDEDFERFPIGANPGQSIPSRPARWRVQGAENDFRVIDIGGSRALSVRLGANGGPQYLIRTFPLRVASDPQPVVRLDFRVRFEPPNDETADGGLEVFLSKNGIQHGARLRIRPYSAGRDLPGFSALTGRRGPGAGKQHLSILSRVAYEVWYEVRIEVDLRAQTFELRIRDTQTDSETTSAALHFPSAGVDQLSRLVFTPIRPTTRLRLALDDLRVESVDTRVEVQGLSRPSSVTATASGPDMVLRWGSSSDRGAGTRRYHLFRDGTQIGSTTERQFVDMGAVGSAPHRYEISAVDSAGRTSSRSDPVLAGTCEVAGGADALDHARLAVDFDGNGNGSFYGAASLRGNPFPAVGHVRLVDVGGPRSWVADFAGHDEFAEGTPRRPFERSALVYDGSEIPDTGTISFRVRWNKRRGWTDGKRTWIAALVPRVGEIGFATNEVGTGLAILKDENNDVILAVHRFSHARLTSDYHGKRSGGVAEATETPIRLPASSLSAHDWTVLRLSWERTTGRVSLGVGASQVGAEIEFGPAPWRVLTLGTPPSTRSPEPLGFDGQIDSLVIDDRYAPDLFCESSELPPELPAPAVPSPARAQPATFFIGDRELELVEKQARQHLARVVEAQESGGWRFAIAFPSFLSFLSQKTVIPYSHRYFNGAKQANSAGVALRLLAAYEVLNEPEYLAAARACADRLIETQRDESPYRGAWPYSALIDTETDELIGVVRPDVIGIEDHVQTHPIALMWRLADLTGEDRYRSAGDQGLQALLTAQNPNGSWSQQVNVAARRGETFLNHPHGGELNDFTTTEAMTVMLWAYRRTNEQRYLAAYLAAARWLTEAFVDNAHVSGWAGQYDETNVPVAARNFEPPAVSLSEGMTGAPLALLDAYRLTGDARYLRPVLKWRDWMLAHRQAPVAGVHAGGWYPYYSPTSGSPLKWIGGREVPSDPRDVRGLGMDGVLDRIDRIERSIPVSRSSHASIQAQIRNEVRGISASNRIFDSKVGSWAFEGDTLHGVSISPATSRLMPMLRALFLGRQRDGSIPREHRFSRRTRSDWYSVLHHEFASADLTAPLTRDERRAANLSR